jgi:hypothetical protein
VEKSTVSQSDTEGRKSSYPFGWHLSAEVPQSAGFTISFLLAKVEDCDKCGKNI